MNRFLLTASLIFCWGVADAQPPTPDKPKETVIKLVDQSQVAVVLKKDGRKVGIILVSLDSKELQFKMNQNETKSRTSSAKTGDIKAVQIKSGDTFAINPNTTAFEPYDTATDTFNAAKDDVNSGKKVSADKGATPKAESEKVIAEGVGTTGDEALKDAFRNAVRQVVGAVVDAETLVKNDEVISDKVLTYSDGFIKQYDEISKKQDKGLLRIKIAANVERRSVVAKLKAANITVKEIEGSGLFAEAITGLEADKNAEALLKKALEGFPLNCLTASVIGQPKLKRDESKTSVQVQIQLIPDYKAYKAFANRLRFLLDKLSLDRGDFLTIYQQSRNGGGYLLYELAGSEYGGRGHLAYTLPAWMPKAFTTPNRGGFGNGGLIDNRLAFALCVNHTNAKDRLEYRYYALDKSLQTLLARVSLRRCMAKMSLLDMAGETIVTDHFKLFEKVNWNNLVFEGSLIAAAGNRYGSGLSFFGGDDIEEQKRSGAAIFLISPVFTSSGDRIIMKPTLSFTRTISVSLDELKSIHRAKVEIQMTE